MALQFQHKPHLSDKFDNLNFTKFGSLDSVTTNLSTPPSSTPCSPSIDSSFTVDILTYDDKDDVIMFLRKFFFKDEPLNYYLRLIDNEHPTCKELEEYSLKDLGSGINLKAVGSNGKIIGVCLNSILERNYINDIESVELDNKKFEKIINLLNKVAIESDIFDKYPDLNKAISVRIVSVDDTWRGKGIARILMDKTRQLGKELGCELMTVDCTSHFTAKALAKLNFKCIYTLNYEDYKVENEIVFSPEPPHKAVTVYTQRI